MEELNRIIQAELDIPILLSYDTTFSLGAIYMSPLLFSHVLFDASPVIPAAFLLQPSLATIKPPIPIVTDDEQGICNAIDKTLTGVVCVKCWNLITNSVKIWLRHHHDGAKSRESYFTSKHTKMPVDTISSGEGTWSNKSSPGGRD